MSLKNDSKPDVVKFGDKIYLAVSVEDGMTNGKRETGRHTV